MSPALLAQRPRCPRRHRWTRWIRWTSWAVEEVGEAGTLTRAADDGAGEHLDHQTRQMSPSHCCLLSRSTSTWTNQLLQ